MTIVSFVDESFPGWVEFQLEDVHGRLWKFQEKVPVITSEDLWANSEYPREGAVACTILERKTDSAGRKILTIATNRPWGVESIDGTAIFEVLAKQVEGHEGDN
jgi:hypothetical protein